MSKRQLNFRQGVVGTIIGLVFRFQGLESQFLGLLIHFGGLHQPVHGLGLSLQGFALTNKQALECRLLYLVPSMTKTEMKPTIYVHDEGTSPST